LTFELRGETPSDYDRIDLVETMAFERMDEGHITPLMRSGYARYDPELSVVALDNGEIIGHTLFTPATIRLMGRDVEAVGVGPVAVHPDHQNRGVGQVMLKYGHEAAREGGYEIAFMHGHPKYYPRVGYVACHGFGQINIDTEKLGPVTQPLRPRPPVADDLPWLVERLRVEFANVDFGWIWNEHLTEWVQPGLNTVVWVTPEGARVGYSVDRHNTDGIKLLLADDPAMAVEILRNLWAHIGDDDAGMSKIALHPTGWLAGQLGSEKWATPTVRSSDAAMAFEITPGVLDEYRREVAAGRRPVGHVNFPLAFEM
jgi:predicted N-acetyltransferase YhbS